MQLHLRDCTLQSLADADDDLQGALCAELQHAFAALTNDAKADFFHLQFWHWHVEFDGVGREVPAPTLAVVFVVEANSISARKKAAPHRPRAGHARPLQYGCDSNAAAIWNTAWEAYITFACRRRRPRRPAIAHPYKKIEPERFTKRSGSPSFFYCIVDGREI